MRTRGFDRGCSEYERLNRRDLLKAGALGGMLSLPSLLQAEAAQAAPRRDISCILVWLRGGPSSIDMWDMKPDAPSDIRGPFNPIPTNVSGLRISEHLPLCAKMADKYCLVRSVTHPRDDHEGGSHVNATGWDTWPQTRYPMYGTTVQKLLGYRGCTPPHVHLPEPPQPYSGGDHYLARQDLPFTISCLNDLDLRVKDVSVGGEIGRSRLDRRRHLLQASDTPVTGPGALANDVFYQRALEILSSSNVRAAFDVTQEPERIRDLYGRAKLATDVVAQGNAGDVAPNDYNRSIIGQSCLLARRLVEAGTRFVTVVGRGWDTHADNFNRLKNDLLPPLDRAVHALITDLSQRGLLDTTLVIVTGDFNRTPKINKDAGRDHWGHVQTIFLAGAGIPAGTVIGASDEQCAYPADKPITPQDIAATIYQRFGIRPEQEIIAPDGRPFRLLPDGSRPVPELV
jgi:hypothetical protein